MIMLVAAPLCVATQQAAAATYSMVYSTSSSRSAPAPLDGATVSGNMYAFSTPDTGTAGVAFYLDDPGMTRAPRRTESSAPHDFNGGTVTAATAFDTRTISDGSHTITLKVTLPGGATEVTTSTFTVSNATTQPPDPPSSGSTFSWATRAPKPQPGTYESNGLMVGSKLYVLGGYVAGGLSPTLRSDVYDNTTNTWSQLADMPSPITHAPAAVDGGTIWLVGGYVGNSPGPATAQVLKYTIATDTWSAGPAIPEPRGAGAAAVVGRELHYFGGALRVGNAYNDTDKGDHWVLNLDGGTTWTPAPALPNPRNHLGAVTVGPLIYVAGGQHDHAEGTTSQGQVDVYDTVTDTWSRAADMPLARSHITTSLIEKNGRIVSVGGSRDNGTSGAAMADVTWYDPETDTWVAGPPLPAVRKDPIAGVDGEHLIVATGNQGGGVAPTTTWSARITDVWESGPAAPGALGEVAGGIIGNRLYLVGEGSDVTRVYNLALRTWTTAATRPFLGHHHAAEVIAGKLYLFGGIGAAAGKVQIYNPVSNSWTTGADMPFAAGSSATALIDGKVYVAGGIVGTTTTAQAAVYTASTNSWTSIAAMKQGRNHAASATDGAKLYVFGGRDGGNTVTNGFDTVQVFDPATNTWQSTLDPGSVRAPLPQSRGGMGKAVFADGEFYVIGGETNTGAGATAAKVYNRVDIYSPATNTWRAGPAMPTARHGIFPAYLNGRIYVALGGIQAANSSSRIVEILATTARSGAATPRPPDPPADTTPPAAPAGVQAVAGAGGGPITVTWSANSEPDLAGYAVYRSTSTPVATSGTPLSGASLLTSRSFADTTGVAGTTYHYVAVAVDGSGNRSPASASASATATALPPASYNLKVDFTTATGPVASGYLRDYGQSYALRSGAGQGSGHTFGWLAEATGVPVDLTKNGRDRTATTTTTDGRMETLMHMQYSGSTTTGTPTQGVWELAVPNGTYQVTVGVGEAGNFYNSTHLVNAEGLAVVGPLTPTATNRFATSTRTVTVTDGRLTLSATGGVNTKITYVDVVGFS